MLILNAQGQTCNKFFIYRNFFSRSIETGEKIIILSPDITIRDFPNLLNSSLVCYPFFRKRLIRIFGYGSLVKLLQYIFANRYSILIFRFFFKIFPNIRYINTSIGEYINERRYEHDSTIKEMFMPSLLIRHEVDSVMEDIRERGDIICGIHIRYGDYREWRDGIYFYTENQYHSLMLNFQKLFPFRRVVFLISSNEQIDLSSFDECECFSIPNGSSTKDLYGLGKCDYIMGPPSSFSGWASYYGENLIYFIEDPTKEISLSLFQNISEIWD